MIVVARLDEVIRSICSIYEIGMIERAAGLVEWAWRTWNGW